MIYKYIDQMIEGKLEHSNIFLGEEESVTSMDNCIAYGECNSRIVDAINDLAPDGPFALICDNVIKFIEYRPSKLETDTYKAIKQKEFKINYAFSYKRISEAYNKKDFDILDDEWHKIKDELNNLIKSPYSKFNMEDKGIIFAYMFYLREAIEIYYNVYIEKEVDKYLDQYKELKKIYDL